MPRVETGSTQYTVCYMLHTAGQRIKQLQVLKDIALRNLGFVSFPMEDGNSVASTRPG